MQNILEDIMDLRSRQSHKKWFNSLVANRDGWKCRKCSSTRSVSAYHITDRDKLPLHGNSLYNGIMLCFECRKIANTGKNECYAPDVLYTLIGSSAAKVIEDLVPKKAKPNDA